MFSIFRFFNELKKQLIEKRKISKEKKEILSSEENSTICTVTEIREYFKSNGKE